MPVAVSSQWKNLTKDSAIDEESEAPGPHIQITRAFALLNSGKRRIGNLILIVRTNQALGAWLVQVRPPPGLFTFAEAMTCAMDGHIEADGFR